MFLSSLVLSLSAALIATVCLPEAAAAPCPEPPPRGFAVLAADGSANLLTRGARVACWWAVDDAGDATVVRRFDLATVRPEALRWDEARQAICIATVEADGSRREQVFPLAAR